MFKTRFISILALLCLTVTSAWAQEVTLLTTIESAGNTSFTSGSKTFDNIATVTFSGEVYNEGNDWGWFSDSERTLAVTAAEGYTITRVKFYTYEGSAFDEEAPFEAILVFENWAVFTKVNGTSIGEGGVKKIEVYGYADTPAASTYTVTLKEGTDDATSWTITPAEATTTGVAAGTEVKATYNGTKKVKSVKAVKKVKPAATVTTAPTAKTGVKAGQNEAIVNAGTADGGTMMYAVTTDATQPASTDGFSATVPTAEGLTAGTYYVWYYVKADATHTDSEISATGIEVTIDAAGPPALNLTSPAVGQVIGDDGKNYNYASLPGGVTAVAKICYVSGSHGLALALADEGEMNLSTAITTCAAHTPAFTGGTWKLATKDEWTNMANAAGGYDKLGLNPGYYWASPEENANNAWNFNPSDGYWYDDEDDDYRVRACLAW